MASGSFLFEIFRTTEASKQKAGRKVDSVRYFHGNFKPDFCVVCKLTEFFDAFFEHCDFFAVFDRLFTLGGNDVCGSFRNKVFV